MALKRVSIFGATGSIGQNTLDLIGRDPERFQVDTLTGAIRSINWRKTPKIRRPHGGHGL